MYLARKMFSKGIRLCCTLIRELRVTSTGSRVQANLDLRNSFFPFLNVMLFNLRKIAVINLKTGRLKKNPYVGEFAN